MDNNELNVPKFNVDNEEYINIKPKNIVFRKTVAILVSMAISAGVGIEVNKVYNARQISLDDYSYSDIVKSLKNDTFLDSYTEKTGYVTEIERDVFVSKDAEKILKKYDEELANYDSIKNNLSEENLIENLELDLSDYEEVKERIIALDKNKDLDDLSKSIEMAKAAKTIQRLYKMANNNLLYDYDKASSILKTCIKANVIKSLGLDEEDISNVTIGDKNDRMIYVKNGENTDVYDLQDDFSKLVLNRLYSCQINEEKEDRTASIEDTREYMEDTLEYIKGSVGRNFVVSGNKLKTSYDNYANRVNDALEGVAKK